MVGFLEKICDAAATGEIEPEDWAQLCGAVWRFLAPLLLKSRFVVSTSLMPAVRRIAAFRQQMALFVDAMTLCCSDAAWTLIVVREKKGFLFCKT